MIIPARNIRRAGVIILAIGTAAPGSDRRLRIWCAAAALLPEIDALATPAGGRPFLRRSKAWADPSPGTKEAAENCLELLKGKNPFKV